MTLTPEEIRKQLARRPTVHQLCRGVFLQEPLRVDDDCLLIPLRPLGYSSQADYLATYVHELTDGDVSGDSVESLRQQGAQAWPVVAIVVFCTGSEDPEHLEAEAQPTLARGREVLAWVSGDDVTPFGLITIPSKGSFFRLLPPHSRRRHRLGFGNTGGDFTAQIGRIIDAAEADERFAFALSLYHDAMRERNEHFRVARLFNCLECLAARCKSADRPSRKAVKYLVGLEDGDSIQVVHEGDRVSFDAIEIAGRVRDKLFHGTPFVASDLNQDSQAAFDVYESNPSVIVKSLVTHCELEIAKWANGASRGCAPGEGSVKTS